jgi:glycine cleavage system regulatory protein
VLVELRSGDVDRLRAAVHEVDAAGLEVRIAPASDEPAPAGQAVQVGVIGRDQPGIVHRVTGLLAALGANIEALDTQLAVAAHSGAPLFRMQVRLRLPPPVSIEQVQTALEEISAEVMVDISVSSSNT